MAEKEEYFTWQEAEAKVGRHVTTIAEIEGIPIGTRGRVVRSEYLMINKGHCVIVKWRSISHEDYFSKTQYNQLLQEV